eukprot:350928-Chlamydomonas_euryale.AAC.1
MDTCMHACGCAESIVPSHASSDTCWSTCWHTCQHAYTQACMHACKARRGEAKQACSSIFLTGWEVVVQVLQDGVGCDYTCVYTATTPVTTRASIPLHFLKPHKRSHHHTFNFQAHASAPPRPQSPSIHPYNVA